MRSYPILPYLIFHHLGQLSLTITMNEDHLDRLIGQLALKLTGLQGTVTISTLFGPLDNEIKDFFSAVLQRSETLGNL